MYSIILKIYSIVQYQEYTLWEMLKLVTSFLSFHHIVGLVIKSVVVSVRKVIFIVSFFSYMLLQSLLYTHCLRWPIRENRMKKGWGIVGGHSPCKIDRPLKNCHSNAMLVHDVCQVAMSCWYHKSLFSASSKEVVCIRDVMTIFCISKNIGPLTVYQVSRMTCLIFSFAMEIHDKHTGS
jgi:hypothetical protein